MRNHLRFRPKTIADGRTLLNLGCGPRANPNWNNIDFSWYARLRRYPRLVALFRSFGLLSSERYAYFLGFPDNVIVWDLRKGIPFSDDSFDAEYSSHLLEHLDRVAVEPFLVECRRVLKPGGILRIVVPDLDVSIRTYVNALKALEHGDLQAQALHQQAIEGLFGQMVLREASATVKQKPLVRWLENRFLGDAQTRGETHRWMYNWYSLKTVLECSGFINVARLDPNISKIPMWEDSNLDMNCDGTVYKPGSLYVEGEKG